MTKLGFYLEELGYIDGKGRTVIENFSSLTTSLVEREDFIEAYNQFNSLRHFVNNEAGAVAVNLDNIVEKLTKDVNKGTSTINFFFFHLYLLIKRTVFSLKVLFSVVFVVVKNLLLKYS